MALGHSGSTATLRHRASLFSLCRLEPRDVAMFEVALRVAKAARLRVFRESGR